MAYLFKHTPLQTNFARQPDLPRADGEPGGRPRPSASICKAMLWHFLDFRLEVVTQRLEYELARARAAHPHPRRLRDRLRRARRDDQDHPRSPTARPTPRKKIMARFELDDEQADAILELKLYKLARLEIHVIQEELDEKKKRGQARSRAPRRAGREGLWGIVREELDELARGFGKADKRRTDHRGGRRGGRVRRRGASSSTRTPTSSSRATAGSSACARSRIPPRRACARATRCSRVVAGSTQGDASCSSRTSARATSCRINDVPGDHRLRRAGAEALQVRRTASASSRWRRSIRASLASSPATRSTTRDATRSR